MHEDPDNTDGIKWLNCALQGDEAVYWVSIGRQGLVLGGVSIGRYWLVLGGTGSVK